MDDLDRLYVSSRRGLWGVFIFLAVSIVAFFCRDFTLSGAVPPGFRELLGPAPPVILITIVLAVSTASSLIVIAGRIHAGREPGSTWKHLFFRLFFYLLYFLVDSLSTHFHAVFISGVVVLALQHYNIWTYTGRAIEHAMTRCGPLASCQRRLSGK
ncbi:MAG TPA: hypothetical protein VI389_01700 [Geobacteraceae bacterium]